MAEHGTNLGHWILLNDTNILAKKSRHMERIIRKATEIQLYPNIINREDDLSLSRSWKPLIHTLKEWKKVLCKNKTHSSS
jgi:hypothetical protein